MRKMIISRKELVFAFGFKFPLKFLGKGPGGILSFYGKEFLRNTAKGSLTLKEMTFYCTMWDKG